MTYAQKEKQFSYIRYQVNEIRKGGLVAQGIVSPLE